MKRMLLFSLAYFPKQVGGAEIAIREITRRIDDVDFSLITMRFNAAEPRFERIGNVSVYRVGAGGSYLSKILFIPRAALLAARLHREQRFDAAWAMMSYMTFPLVLLRLAGVRIPYALTLQEGDPFGHVFRRSHIRLVIPLLRSGFRNAEVVQTISTFLAKWTSLMAPDASVEVVPNGVDTAHFSHAIPAERIRAIKEKLGKKEGDIFLITTSRLVHKNALDDAIRALPLLPKTVHFVILGTGPDEAKLRGLSKDECVETRVHFLGQVGHADMPAYLKACDIFIRPSRSEGMGNSFVEAMAAGLPVIATQEGGIADFLFDEERNPNTPTTGWAVDKDSPQQIAQAVKDILARPEKVRVVVKDAYDMVIKKYDWNLVARDMREKIFGAVLGKGE